MTYVKTFGVNELEGLSIIPNRWDYGQYGGSGNYGSHTQAVQMRGVTYYFSYTTLVAFKHWSHELVCRENIWGPTTGKHLNWVRQDACGSSTTVSKAAFFTLLYNIFEEHGMLPPGAKDLLPKRLQVLETDEIIDARKDAGKVYTLGRKWAKQEAQKDARKKKARKKEGIQKRKLTMQRLKAERIEEKKQEDQQKKVVAALRNADLCVDMEERML